MTNYRRLISYIYSYEGGIKGKNIGFAKLESRNGQCKLSVNVKKVYVGSSDLSVYLLAPGKEIDLGNIFIRGGSGEFRAVISVENAADSGCGLDQCYGLTIHEQKDSWRAYTTIWEDAVAHAAEVELADVTSGNLGNSQTQIHKKVAELEKEINDKVLSSSGEPALPDTVPLQDMNQESMEAQGKNDTLGEPLPVWGEAASQKTAVENSTPSETREQPQTGQSEDIMASEIQEGSGVTSEDQGGEWTTGQVSPEYKVESGSEMQSGYGTQPEAEAQSGYGAQPEAEAQSGYEPQPEAEAQSGYEPQREESRQSWYGMQKKDPVQTEYGERMDKTARSQSVLHSTEALRADRDMDKSEGIGTRGQTMGKMQTGYQDWQDSGLPFTKGHPHPVVLPDTSMRQQRGMPYKMNRYPRVNMPMDADMPAVTNMPTDTNAPTHTNVTDTDTPTDTSLPTDTSIPTDTPITASTNAPEALTPSGRDMQQAVTPQPRRPIPYRGGLWHQRGGFLKTSIQTSTAEQAQPTAQGRPSLSPAQATTQAQPPVPVPAANQVQPPPAFPAGPSPMSQAEESPRITDADRVEMLLGNPQELERLEQEEQEKEQENPGPRQLWEEFRKRYPKIQAFDSVNGCEILTIKPQDIGLLPRENWNYGNNSFLLHGYYNYRYLILARIGEESQGRVRYILGVPGHYYSNEKYMASMFGFPHFVLSKKQPSQDGRFGYWYRDVRMQNQD